MSEVPVRFVLLGIQRPGTTLLDTLLRSHPSVASRGEVFLAAHRRWPARTHIKAPQPHFYRHVLARSLLARLRHAVPAWRPAQLRRYLDALHAPGGDLGPPARAAATGFRLMVDQARALPAVLEWLEQQPVRVVRLRRRNLLKTLVSREVHRLRGRSQMRRTEAVPRARLDAGTLRARLEALADEDRRAAALLPDKPALELTYEDLVADRAGQMARVFDWLGVPEHAVDSPLLKITPDDLSRALENHAEVARALSGTRWEWCLHGDSAP